MKRILLSLMVFMVLAASASAQAKVTGRVMALSPSSGSFLKLLGQGAPF